MKDIISDVLDHQDKLSMKEFIGDKEENSSDVEAAEFDEESQLADIETIDPDNELNFLGLHPNHRKQMRSRVMTAQIMRNNSVSKTFGGED